MNENSIPTLNQGFILNDGLRLHYLKSGDSNNPSVIFLHGAGLSAYTWKRVIADLSLDFHCIAPDLRGHGDSDWHPEGDYELETHQRDVVALIAELDVESAVVVGMSLGGAVALTVAAAHPTLIAGLVMIDTGPAGTRAEGRKRLDGLLHGPQEYRSIEEAIQRAMSVNPQSSRAELARSLERNMRQDEHGTWTWKWDPRVRWRNASMTKAEEHQYAERRARTLMIAAAGVQCPTLIVRGQESDMFLEEDIEEARKAFPFARSETIQGAGHYVQRDNPSGLAKAVRSYLTRDLSLVR